jgi:hypothetical protein
MLRSVAVLLASGLLLGAGTVPAPSPSKVCHKVRADCAERELCLLNCGKWNNPEVCGDICMDIVC